MVFYTARPEDAKLKKSMRAVYPYDLPAQAKLALDNQGENRDSPLENPIAISDTLSC